jgi:hypothetical protein
LAGRAAQVRVAEEVIEVYLRFKYLLTKWRLACPGMNVMCLAAYGVASERVFTIAGDDRSFAIHTSDWAGSSGSARVDSRIEAA